MAERKAHKDPVQRLGVVCCRERTRILHVGLEVPELLQSDARDIDDIVGLRDGRYVGIWTVGSGGEEGEGEVGKVLIECEKAEEFCGGLSGIGRRCASDPISRCPFPRMSMGSLQTRRLLVRCDIFGVQVAHLKDIDWDTSLVSSANPLRVLSSALDLTIRACGDSQVAWSTHTLLYRSSDTRPQYRSPSSTPRYP